MTQIIKAKIYSLCLDPTMSNFMLELTRTLVPRNDKHDKKKVVETLCAPLTVCEREVIPPFLTPFYSSYGANTEFYNEDNTLILLSRNEIMNRCKVNPKGFVDFAYNSAGMGYMYMHTLHRNTVLTTVYGGASHGTRQRDALRRAMLFEEYSFSGDAGTDVIVHENFVNWYRAQTNAPMLLL